MSSNFFITVVDITATSADLSLFLDMIDNPQNYKGRTLYVKRLDKIAGSGNWPDPFLFPNKFYFNEDGEWFESPFVKGDILK